MRNTRCWLACVLGQTAWAAATLAIPANGVYLGIWANPALASNEEGAIEIREGPAPNGINHPIALHLRYLQWTDIANELVNGVFQPDQGLRGDISHGRVPVLSWACDATVPNSDHVIAGGDPNEDAVITATAKALAQYPGPVLLRWFWEFNLLTNNQTCRGDTGGTPTQQVYNDFIGAWRHIRSLFQSAGAANVAFLWNPGDYPSDGDKRDPHAFYPGNDYVDWIGVDTYQRAITDTFDDDFGLFYADFSTSQYGNKPLMAGENGAQNVAQNNSELQWTYLRGLLTDVQANRYPLLKAYDYFDSGSPESWVLDNNNGQGNGGLAAYAELAASPSFSAIPGEARPIQSATFYVAVDGDDSWSGRLPAPNTGKTDGPFATFDHARAAVQALNKSGLNQVIVQFRGGTYFLPNTENLTAADSGSAGTEIIYENYPRETPVFSGGVRVQNWTNINGNVWKTTLPASTQYFENLFYNGVRRLRPRLGGYLGQYFRNIGPLYSPTQTSDCSILIQGSGWECFDRFQYNPADPIADTWKNLAPPAGNLCKQPAGNPALVGDIELVNFEQYSVSKLRVSCVDTTNHVVYLTGDTATEQYHPDAHGFLPNHRYLIENVQDGLTQPGQWFLDRSVSPWTLTYLANPGEDASTDTVIVPQLPQLLVASGLQYVTFRGLTFEHDNYTMPATGYDGSSDIVSSVSFQNSQNVAFDSDTIAHTSGAGIEFISCVKNSKPWCVANSASAVTAHNVIENSAFYDIAADAIRIGLSGNANDTNDNVPQFNTIENDVVEGYGRVYPGSKGIGQGEGHDNLYTHNDVYDGYKGAIKVCHCASSDANPPFTNNNIVSFNRVYDLFQGLMNDSGSIYFGVGNIDPPSSGTGNKMLNNVVHDVNDSTALGDIDGYGGDGLYVDDYSGSVDIENNLVYRVSDNAMSFSGPRAGPNQQSTVKNNTFAYARGSLINAYDPYAFTSVPPSPLFFVATGNIFYFDRTSSSSFYVQGGCAYAGPNTPYTNFQQFDGNLYWRTDGQFATDPQAFHVQQKTDKSNNCGGESLWTFYNFAGWQGIAEDVHGVVENPGFKSPTYPADDFSLPNGSPGVGFAVFDTCEAGVLQDPAIHAAFNPEPLDSCRHDRQATSTALPAVPATFPTASFNPATDF